MRLHEIARGKKRIVYATDDPRWVEKVCIPGVVDYDANACEAGVYATLCAAGMAHYMAEVRVEDGRYFMRRAERARRGARHFPACFHDTKRQNCGIVDGRLVLIDCESLSGEPKEGGKL